VKPTRDDAHPVWVLDVDGIETRCTSRDAVIEGLAAVEARQRGRLTVRLDRGQARGALRVLGAAERDVTPCFAAEWVDRYAGLIFLDDDWSEYRASDAARPVTVDESLRLQIAHGEGRPQPAEECMDKGRAFEAMRHFVTYGVRPEWLTYRYVR
jgi:hypothetical protein